MATGVRTSSESDETSLVPAERTPAGWYRFWQKELIAADKRFKKFIEQGGQINDRFLNAMPGGDDITHRLPLFHSNVTTLSSMLYGSTPKVDVSREHADPDDDIARVAAMMLQRILQADVDPSGEDIPTTLKAALQDRLLPGLGAARVRYEFEATSVTVLNPMTGTTEQSEQLAWEEVPVDYVHWQDIRWGWARTWNEIPWLAFRAYLDRDSVKKRFGEKIASKLEYKQQNPNEESPGTDTDDASNIEKAEIWEIWRKADRRVYWYSTGAELILDSQDDPLQLEGFWPMPRPLTANVTTSLFMPRADYVINQDLYNQIDELNTRITIITRAIKVVGVYDQSAEGIRRMLTEGVENDLIPVDNWAMFAEKGGLKGTIDWFPVETVVGVLKTLGEVLDRTIQVLYDVTGMSDVLRGANTDQYVSDGTNQLTARFGSIRVQCLQDEFARFASELEALKAEVIAKHFSPNSIASQAGASFLPQPDRRLIGPALGLIKSPQLKWRVDIRPETIAMVDYAQLKAERTGFLNSMATYIQSAQAAAREIPGAVPMLLELLKWAMAGFKGSNELEGIMDQAIDEAKKSAMQPPKDDGKAAAEQAKAQGEMQKIQMQQQADMQKIAAKAQADQAVINQKFQMEIQREQQKHQHKLEQDMASLRTELQKIQGNLMADLRVIAAKLGADLQVERAKSAFAIAEVDAEYRADSALQQQAADAAEDAMENEQEDSD